MNLEPWFESRPSEHMILILIFKDVFAFLNVFFPVEVVIIDVDDLNSMICRLQNNLKIANL